VKVWIFKGLIVKKVDEPDEAPTEAAGG